MTRVTYGLVLALAITTVSGTPASAHHRAQRGFLTQQPSMLAAGDRSDVTFSPIMTTGDRLAGGYEFASIPDGIAVREGGRGQAELFVNHETSRAPFPFNPTNPTAANGENDFDNAQVSRLSVDRRTGAVLAGSFAVPSSDNYQRFCSSTLIGRRVGSDRELLLTNEEAVEWVNRSGDAWPPPAPHQGVEGARQAGVAVALDVRTGRRTPIWGMGRFNHENTVAVPGYRGIVTFSGDDTFASNPAQSQLYSYRARDSRSLVRDKGDLYAFVSDDPAVQSYYDFAPGSTTSVSGHFIKVPKDIATGRNAEGRDLVAADVGYPPPPAGLWASDAFGAPVDGPQWVLEHWSDLNGVFQFVRLEDMAYDKRPGRSNVLYLADTGRGSSGQGPGVSTNGRVFKMVLDRKDPAKVRSLSVFLEGDDNPVKTLGEVHQPDNLETTRNSLLITEDPGSSQQFPVGSTDPAATTSRLWRVPLDDPSAAEVVARVDQSADGGPTDVDGRSPGNLGAWEVSGIVDASSVFGKDAFLADVQAHSLWIAQAPGADVNGDGAPDFTDKREGGQLVLLRIPGA
jgi:secreted PhoX family phosphatase